MNEEGRRYTQQITNEAEAAYSEYMGKRRVLDYIHRLEAENTKLRSKIDDLERSIASSRPSA